MSTFSVSQNLVDLLLKTVILTFQIDRIEAHGHLSGLGLDILNIGSVKEPGLTQSAREVGWRNTL